MSFLARLNQGEFLRVAAAAGAPEEALAEQDRQRSEERPRILVPVMEATEAMGWAIRSPAMTNLRCFFRKTPSERPWPGMLGLAEGLVDLG